MKKNSAYGWLLLLLVNGSLPLIAQKAINLEEYTQKYQDEKAIILSKKESSEIALKNGQLQITNTVSEDMLILTSKANSFGEKSIFYSSFNEINDIEAHTLIPNGSRYKTEKAKNIVTQNEISSGSFYDDLKSKKIFFANVQPGARLSSSYSEVVKEPRFFTQFFFSSFVQVQEAELSIKVPKDVKINYRLFNISEKELLFTKEESRKYTTYTWKALNVKHIQSESDGPSLRYYDPHIVVYIDEYTYKNKTTKLLSGPDELYKWYYSLVKDVNKEEHPALKHIVDSLVKDVTDEVEKVKRVYYWVQDNIKYVAFEDGLAGFIPRNSSTVCDKRYGDCKDMASIITSMLKMAGVPAYLTWIGTRSIPYTYREVPMPMVDNHMIATYVKEGVYYFLDGTGKNTPWGFHTSMIQGKEALIGKGENSYEIVKVPEISKEKNIQTDSVYLTIINKSLTGIGHARASGYPKINLTYSMQGISEEEKLKLLKRLLQKGSNKFIVDSIYYHHLSDKEKELELNYKFRLPDYLQENKDELYLNLNLDKAFQNDILEADKRKVAREVDFKFTDFNTTVLELPKGYEVGYLPSGASFQSEKFGFSITYRRDKNKLYCDKKIYMDTLMITTSDFEEWNKMIKQLNKAYNESIILKKTTN